MFQAFPACASACTHLQVTHNFCWCIVDMCMCRVIVILGADIADVSILHKLDVLDSFKARHRLYVACIAV